MSIAPNPIEIKFFKTEDGLRTPYTLVMDNERNLISMLRDEAALARIKSSPHLLRRHSVAAEPALNPLKPWIPTPVVHITDGGIVVSKEPLDEWETLFEYWMSPEATNPFVGTDELRTGFLQDMAATAALIASGGCNGCESNRLKVSYRIKLRKALGL